MKKILYIVLFIGGLAHAQDSIAYKNEVVTPNDTLAGPLPTFLQTLQGSMPNHGIVPYQLKNDNPYTLTQADKDSVYAAAFNGQIVQQAIKTNFNGKSKLYKRGHELEFISMLLNDSITNDLKKKLLIGRILGEWQYAGKSNVSNNILINTGDYINLNGNELHNADNFNEISTEERREAIVDFFTNHSKVNFLRMLYVIDGIPYGIDNNENLQVLLAKLRRVDIEYIKLLTGTAASSIFGHRAANGIIVIKSKH